jgi:hypothetical protein
MLTATVLLTGCSRSPVPEQSTSTPTQHAKGETDSLSWIPRTDKYSSEASKISAAADLLYIIPKKSPLRSTGSGGIDSYGNFVPRTDKQSLMVFGGTLASRVGITNVEASREASFGSWDFIYADTGKSNVVGWGYSLTNGEVIVSREQFRRAPTNRVVFNRFEIETFGDKYLIIRLDPRKRDSLCLFDESGQSRSVGALWGPFPVIPTAGYVGSTADVGGTLYERTAHGWRPHQAN